MKYDIRGNEKKLSAIKDFVSLLNQVSDLSLWIFNGMIVEIDPTVDYTTNNVLIRWTDIDEGFNDKLIYQSKKSFLRDFKLYSNA